MSRGAQDDRAEAPVAARLRAPSAAILREWSVIPNLNLDESIRCLRISLQLWIRKAIAANDILDLNQCVDLPVIGSRGIAGPERPRATRHAVGIGGPQRTCVENVERSNKRDRTGLVPNDRTDQWRFTQLSSALHHQLALGPRSPRKVVRLAERSALGAECSYDLRGISGRQTADESVALPPPRPSPRHPDQDRLPLRRRSGGASKSIVGPSGTMPVGLMVRWLW